MSEPTRNAPYPFAGAEPSVLEALEFAQSGWAANKYPIAYEGVARVLARELIRTQARCDEYATHLHAANNRIMAVMASK
jgi:hypothetical protein